MKKTLFALPLLGLTFIITPVFAASDMIKIHGSSTVGLRLMPALMKAWLNEEGYAINSDTATEKNKRAILAKNNNKSLLLKLETEGSSSGFKSLKKGTADLGMSSRPIKQKEVDSLVELGDMKNKNHELVVGIDGIAVITHPSNPVKSLSVDQLRKIYLGQVSNWSSLGGRNQPIHAYTRDNHSGTFDTFKSLVLGKKAKQAPQTIEASSNQSMADNVRNDPSGIGFVSLSFTKNLQTIAISDGKNDSILPTELSIATEDYPLSRRLFIYKPSTNKESIARLINFIKSEKGQKIVKEEGFISQNIQAYNVELTNTYPKEYKELLTDAERLSLNFRFKPGTYQLDNKSMQDLDRLTKYLKKTNNKHVILAGFTDDTEESNTWRKLALSAERSDFVASALIKQGMRPKNVRGFGSSIQVANNRTEFGRDKNRRVEIWVKNP